MAEKTEDRPAAEEKKTPAQQIDELFKDLNRSDAPGLTVGVAQRGQRIYHQGFGLACVQLGVANGRSTRMRIGSTSKHFTAVAALMLAQEGKLDLDAPVTRYLPELPALYEQATLRRLMSHVSGQRCYLDVNFVGNGRRLQPPGSALAAQVRQSELNFPVGNKFIYNNGGYHLVSICIERVSGLAFEKFVAQRIFEPMGMFATESAPDDFDLYPGLATLHVPKPGGGWRRGIFPTEEVRGEGGMISTVGDMLRWLEHLRKGNDTLLTADSREQLMRPALLNDGTSTQYALGLMVHPYRGVDVVHHGGGVIGGTCQMLTVPAHELDIVIITNGAAVSPIESAYKIIDLLLGDQLAPMIEMAKAADYATLIGTQYHASGSGMLIGFAEAADPAKKEQLGLSLLGNPAVPLRRNGERLELPIETMALGPFSVALAPLPAEGTAPASLEIKEGSSSERFERLAATPPTAAEVAADLGGNYFSVEADASGTLVLDADGKIEMRMQGRVGSIFYEVQPLSSDVLRLQAKDPTLPLVLIASIDRKNGKAAGMRLSSGRTRGLRFTRQA